MKSRPKNLPDFDSPPISEVLLGVQFITDKPLRTVHLGGYWQTIKSDFPNVEEHPPLPEQRESLEPIRAEQRSVELLQEPPLRRCWFLDASQNRLIQVQPDRFVHNWRKVAGGESYPRYESISREFLRRWAEFSIFVENEGLGKPRISLAELTYVNHIEKEGCWSEIGDACRIFSFCSGSGSLGFLPRPESLSWDLNYLLPDKKGRLYVSLRPAIRRRDARQILQLSLAVRGPLEGSLSEKDMEAWFKLAREWIVKGFTDLTTPFAHDYWKRNQ